MSPHRIATRPWFSGSLDFSPTCSDLASEGFPPREGVSTTWTEVLKRCGTQEEYVPPRVVISEKLSYPWRSAGGVLSPALSGAHSAVLQFADPALFQGIKPPPSRSC